MKKETTYKKCIYCTHNVIEKSREHVIPGSFGTFSTGTWTLHNVCKICNSKFGTELDIELARNSVEGLKRQILTGIKSNSNAKMSNLTIRAPDNHPEELIRNAIFTFIPSMQSLKLESQFGFLNDHGKRKYFSENDALALDLKEKKLTTKQMSVLCSLDEKNELERLEKIASELFGYKRAEHRTISNLGENLLCSITGVVTRNLRRAIAKIAFNFIAYLDKQENIIFNPAFNNIKKFITKDISEINITFNNEPILFDETSERRRPLDGFVIIAENLPSNKIRVCIQFYDQFTYYLEIAEKIALPQDYGYFFPVGKLPQKLANYVTLKHIGFIIPGHPGFNGSPNKIKYI